MMRRRFAFPALAPYRTHALGHPQTTSASSSASLRAWAMGGLWTGALLGLLCFAPAAWLSLAIKHLSGERLQLLNPQGHIWQGSAQLVLSSGGQGQDALALPGAVHWRISPAWLGFDAQVRADCCTHTQPITLTQRWGWGAQRFTIEAAHPSVWPAAVLAGLGTPWNTIELQGSLVMQETRLALTWSAGRLATSGQAQWQALDMSSPVSTLKPLGSYQMRLLGGETTRISLSTLSGDLLLNGEGQWVGAKLRFQGEAKAGAGREAALSSLLNLIGQRRGAQALISIG